MGMLFSDILNVEFRQCRGRKYNFLRVLCRNENKLITIFYESHVQFSCKVEFLMKSEVYKLFNYYFIV